MTKPKRGCGRCKLLSEVGVDGQVFEWNGLIFDVSKARAIVESHPREPIDVPPGQTAEVIYETDINLRHVRHVDIRFPSIVVKRKRIYVFIDGNHRAFARLCRKLPIKAFLLTARETRAILSKK